MNKLIRNISCLFALVATTATWAQSSTFDFENTIPNNLKNNGGKITLSNEHCKNGAQALQWEAKANTTLEFDLGKASYHNTIVFLPIYNLAASDDKLLLRFFADGEKKELVRESEMLLNYKGWREFHRHISMDFGSEAKQGGFRILEITFVPQSPNTAKTVWLDAISLEEPNRGGLYQRRVPGPHLKADYEKGFLKSTDDVYLNGYFKTPTSPTTPSAQELAQYAQIKEQFLIDEKYIHSSGTTTATMLPYLKKEACERAKKLVASLQITFNKDGSVTGKPLPLAVFSDPKELLKVGYNVLALAHGAQALNDKEAEKQLIIYTQYILDQGIAEGGRAIVPTNSYEICRTFLPSFMYAMPVYQKQSAALANEVHQMLRWNHTFGQVYGEFEPELTIDFVYLKAHYLFTLADLQPDDVTRIRDVKDIKRFYERIVEPQPGASSIIKPDGTGYHHNAQHNSYMYGMSNWINTMHKLRGTTFKVSMNAYRQVAKFAKVLYLQTASNKKGAFYGNSLSGRGPFNLAPGINYGHLARLIEIGGDCMGQGIDPDMAAFYNYLSGESKYNVTNIDWDGYYALNYGNMGIYRTPFYTVDMRGLSSATWGTEIYSNANRFGRYQSYGAIEILYKTDNILAASGYPAAKTWDWNVVPGATTVHTSWESLNPVKPRADEIQKSDFAGAVTSGESGLFALEFIEDAKNYWGGEPNRYPANNLTFKQSVFADNGLLICLGSNISAQPADEKNNLATNLFQHIFTPESDETMLGKKKISNDGETTLSLADRSQWVLSPAGTGFYIPKQPITLQIVRGEQTTPKHNATADKITDYETAKAVKGWLRHDNKTNGSYEYIILPARDKVAMEMFAKEADKGKLPYRVLQKDDKAHVLTVNNGKTTAYTLFNANTNLPGVIKNNSTACLLIAKEEGNELKLFVCDPTLNREKNKQHRWVSTPQEITLTVSGVWQCDDKNTTTTVNGGNTQVKLILTDGLTLQVILRK